MDSLQSGKQVPQGNSPKGPDRKVKLLLVLLLLLGGTLAFLATPYSERTLGVKLSSLFSSADDAGKDETQTDQQDQIPVDCIQAPCDTGGGSGGTVFDCIQAPCQNPNLSILNPEPKTIWEVGKSYQISWDGVAGKSVSIRLKSPNCDEIKLCLDDLQIVNDAPNTGTFEWQVPPNIPTLFLNKLNYLIVTIDSTSYNQVQVEITNGNGGGTVTDNGTYIYFNRNPFLVYKKVDNTKRRLPYPYQEAMRCLGADPTSVQNGTQLQQALPDGAPLFCNPFKNSISRNGSLLSGFPDSDPTAIFFVENGQRRPFPSHEIFTCLGYDYADVHLANSKDVANPGLPMGEPMTCADVGAPLTLGGDGTLPGGKVNITYSAVITASGGTEPYTWQIISVEPNATVTIDNKGQISGKFTQPGTYRITVQVCDNSSDFAPNCVTKVYTVEITDNGGGTGGGGSGGGGSGSGQNCVGNDVTSLVALYRYYNNSDSDHYYTTNSQAPAGFVSEGITAYVYNKQVPGTVAMYQSYNSATKEHYYTTDSNATQSYGYRLDGVVGYIYPTQVNGSYSMYRMYNDSGKNYLITTSTVERDAIVSLGFVQQGNVGYACGVPRPGSEIIPIYRLWNNRITDHFFTIDIAERDLAMQNGYVSEGISGYVYSVPGANRIPVFRLWSSRFGDHFYTTNESEAVSSGYNREGILGYISANPSNNMIQWYRLFNTRTGDHFYTTSTEERDSAVRGGYRFEGTMGYLP